MTITGNPPKKGNPYGMKSRWFFVLQVAWDSISKLMPLILWFFAQECPGVWGFQPPRGWLVNGGKGKFFLKLTIHRCLEDYFHSHNLAGVSLYLRILRERSQQIYCASETCWNIFHFPPKKREMIDFHPHFPHSFFDILMKVPDWSLCGTLLDRILREGREIQKSAQTKNICLKSFKRIPESRV